MIFLFTDGIIGTQAWLQSYHGQIQSTQQGLYYQTLKYHAGEIRESINLDFPGDSDYTHVGLLIQGLNGQQTNADIVSVVTKLCQWIGIPISIHYSDPVNVNQDNFWEYYRNAGLGLIEYAKYQALGFPIANHALYTRYRIEAITLVGLVSQNKYKGVGLHHIS